jgi:hypothetical protein
MEGLALICGKAIPLKKPFLGLDGDLLPVTADSQFKVAMGHEVRKNKRLGGR